MATYLDMKNLLAAQAEALNLEFETLDGFEINAKSQSWERHLHYLLNDVGSLDTNDEQQKSGQIQNGFNFTLIFAKNVSGDDNQENKDPVYSELFTLCNQFMFGLNKANTKSLPIKNWSTKRRILTVNHFLAVQLKIVFPTTCNR